VQLQLATGLEFNQVGYRGGGRQLTGLVAGEVPHGLVAISSAFTHVQGVTNARAAGAFASRQAGAQGSRAFGRTDGWTHARTHRRDGHGRG
jgi:tripartite-type tricarboxylate transporter receptor subunit TctC